MGDDSKSPQPEKDPGKLDTQTIKKAPDEESVERRSIDPGKLTTQRLREGDRRRDG